MLFICLRRWWRCSRSLKVGAAVVYLFDVGSLDKGCHWHHLFLYGRRLASIATAVCLFHGDWARVWVGLGPLRINELDMLQWYLFSGSWRVHGARSARVKLGRFLTTASTPTVIWLLSRRLRLLLLHLLDYKFRGCMVLRWCGCLLLVVTRLSE